MEKGYILKSKLDFGFLTFFYTNYYFHEHEYSCP